LLWLLAARKKKLRPLLLLSKPPLLRLPLRPLRLLTQPSLLRQPPTPPLLRQPLLKLLLRPLRLLLRLLRLLLTPLRLLPLRHRSNQPCFIKTGLRAGFFSPAILWTALFRCWMHDRQP
jgi:hypothetical protein